MTIVFREFAYGAPHTRPVQSRAVRQSGGGPVVCEACGCRLEERDSAGATWQHFAGSRFGRDARGCSVDCVADTHELFIAYS